MNKVVLIIQTPTTFDFTMNRISYVISLSNDSQ